MHQKLNMEKIYKTDETVSEQVVRVLVPLMKELKAEIRGVKEDISHLNESVNSLRETVSSLEQHTNKTVSELSGVQSTLNISITSNTQQLSHVKYLMDTLDLKLCSVNDTVVSTLETVSNINESVSNINETVSNINESVSNINETVSNVNETVSNVIESVDTHTEQLEGLVSYIKGDLRDLELQQEERIVTKVADLHTSLQSSISQLKDEVDIAHGECCTVDDMSSLNDSMSRMRDAVTHHDQNMTTTITKLNVDIWQNITSVVRPETYECGGTGGWSRVGYLNMTNPNTTCPSGWQLTGHSKRTCGKASSSSLTCDSVFFPFTRGLGSYTRVCGRIIGYQYHPTDAFEAYNNDDATTIDEAYVSGVSLTHGSPRQHIWTFAAGLSEAYPTRNDVCPCDSTVNIAIPSFVGGDYFCESGANSLISSGFRGDDPLWDGEGCSTSSRCCSFNDPPYFTKQLSRRTFDDIEARICQQDGSDDTPIEFIELYVQ